MNNEEYFKQLKEISVDKIPDRKFYWFRKNIYTIFESNLKKGLQSKAGPQDPNFVGEAAKINKVRLEYDNLANYYSVMYRGGFLLNYFGFAIAITIAAFALCLLYYNVLTGSLYDNIVQKILIVLGLLKIGTISLIICNTLNIREKRINQKHIDFRYVAERLRIDQSYAILGRHCTLTPKLGDHLKGIIVDYPGQKLYEIVKERLTNDHLESATISETSDSDVITFMILGQHHFHEDREVRHDKYEEKLKHKSENLNKAVLCLVVTDVIIAFAHMIYHVEFIATLHYFTGIIILFTISLPAFVAAYTGIAAQSDYYKLSLRNKRLKEELKNAKDKIKSCTDDKDEFDNIAQKLTDEVIEWTLIYEKKVHEL